MFRNLFRNWANPPSQKSDEDKVYDFADVLGKCELPFHDERSLPHPKQELIHAFCMRLATLRLKTKHLSECTEEYNLTIQLAWRLFDFQTFDPEDQQDIIYLNRTYVDRYNRLEAADNGAGSLSSDDLHAAKRQIELNLKYMQRAEQELEKWRPFLEWKP